MIKNPRVEFEERWEVSSGSATIIPMNSKWTAVGVQVSGGLDSAILLLLVVKTIQKYNLDVKIVPISLEIHNKAKNLESARAVIAKVKEITGFENFGDSVEVVGNERQAKFEEKDRFFDLVLSKLFHDKVIDFEINGITKNPPIEVCKEFKFNEFRESIRDNPTTIYNGDTNASCHAFMTKKDIIELYKTHNVLDDLASLTLSCDENLDIIIDNGWDIPCGTCWWCAERRWGFESNDLSYEKYSPVNAYPK